MCSDISLEQVKMIQDEFDTDNSGNIDVSQFTIMMVSRKVVLESSVIIRSLYENIYLISCIFTSFLFNSNY